MWVQVPLQSVQTSDFAPVSRNEFLDILATIGCGCTLKRVRDMITTYSQMNRTDKYSQHSPIIWPVWLNGWVFVYELSDCGFEFRWSQMTNIFLEKPFSKKSKNRNRVYFWINSLTFYRVCFYCKSKSRAIEIYWN